MERELVRVFGFEELYNSLCRLKQCSNPQNIGMQGLIPAPLETN
jgi:hypothetical protein